MPASLLQRVATKATGRSVRSFGHVSMRLLPQSAANFNALVEGRVFNADFHRQWLDSPEPTNPGQPTSTQYGYGFERQTFAPNVTMYYHFGEMPGFSNFTGYDPGNKVTLVIWSTLTVGVLDGVATAQTLLNKVVAVIYTPPSQASSSAPPPRPNDHTPGATAPRTRVAPGTTSRRPKSCPHRRAFRPARGYLTQMWHAFAVAAAVAHALGARLVVAHGETEPPTRFLGRLGFQAFDVDPRCGYLRMQDVEAAFSTRGTPPLRTTVPGRPTTDR